MSEPFPILDRLVDDGRVYQMSESILLANSARGAFRLIVGFMAFLGVL